MDEATKEITGNSVTNSENIYDKHFLYMTLFNEGSPRSGYIKIVNHDPEGFDEIFCKLFWNDDDWKNKYQIFQSERK